MRTIYRLCAVAALLAAGAEAQDPGERFMRAITNLVAKPPRVMPLYKDAIPNAKSAPDHEQRDSPYPGAIAKVSRPTLTVYLPGKDKASGAGIVIFPGGGYVMESYTDEGTHVAQAFQDRGIAAFLVKYRLPDDATMEDKSVGPLQDAQQALRVVRENASEWGVDAAKIGVIGFSAGGHLASTTGTHFDKAYGPTPAGANLRPDFMVLVYPVISMKPGLTHQGSHDALLGSRAGEDKVRLFSNEEQVTPRTPPTLLLHATDDMLVDVDNSVQFYQALHRNNVPAEMIVFQQGNHGFLGLSRGEWMEPVFTWMVKNGWAKP
jgi:acetyl esterase/lipase